jgi:hypothetical protein
VSEIESRIAVQPGGEAAQQGVIDKVKNALGTADYEFVSVEVVGRGAGIVKFDSQDELRAAI